MGVASGSPAPASFLSASVSGAALLLSAISSSLFVAWLRSRGASSCSRLSPAPAPAPASPAQLRLGPAYGLPLLPHYPYIPYSNFVPNVIHNLSP